MAKAYFLIKDKVQEVGYRAFVMERLLETNLKGGAVNTEDGNLKVLLEGKKKDIIAFVERLKREMPELAENPVLIGPEFDDSLQIPDEIRVAHSLEMNQFGKAVVYLDGIDKKLDSLPDKINENLGGKIEELGKEIIKMNSELGNKMDALLREIARALRAGV